MLLVFLGIELHANQGLHAKGHLVPIILNAGEHLFIGRSRDGKIQLEDGTRLQAISSEAAKVSEEWDYNEHITFSPNPYPGGGSEFYVLNIDRGEFVHADLYSHPNPVNEYTLKIFHIDPYDGEIILRTNASEEQDWQVEKKDLGILDEWGNGDRVIIGMNSNWFASFFSDCKYIMVNCDKHPYTSYVRIKPY
ncbi:MAG: hypothetical protein KFB93_05930 [Simkaniaceae bacterium]|nr:MAG: hypothetical protein KFB93_05930 [Simkaniaceae bacterium]